MIARDVAVELLGEGPLSTEKVTLVFNADDVDASVRAFVDGGATVVKPVRTLDAAGSKRAVLHDPGGVLLEVSRPVGSWGSLLDESRT